MLGVIHTRWVIAPQYNEHLINIIVSVISLPKRMLNINKQNKFHQERTRKIDRVSRSTSRN